MQEVVIRHSDDACLRIKVLRALVFTTRPLRDITSGAYGGNFLNGLFLSHLSMGAAGEEGYRKTLT